MLLEKEGKLLWKALKSFGVCGEVEYTFIADLLLRCFKKDMEIFAFAREEGGRRVFYQYDEPETGYHRLLPLFFTEDVEKSLMDNLGQAGWTLQRMKFRELGEMVASQKDGCLGVTIDPFDLGFILAPVAFQMAMALQEPQAHVCAVRGDMLSMSGDALLCPTDRTFSGSGEMEKQVALALKMSERVKADIRSHLCQSECSSGDVADFRGEMVDVSPLDYDHIFFQVSPEVAVPKEIYACLAVMMYQAAKKGAQLVITPCVGIEMWENREEYVKATLAAYDGWIGLHPGQLTNLMICCPDEETQRIYHTFLQARHG